MLETEAGKKILGTVLEGKYRIDRLIGGGGMGEVYEATHLGIDRKVAMKLLHPEYVSDENVRKRFDQEARITGSIRSDHICEVTDAGIAADGSPFIVMPLLEGSSLEDILKTERKLPLERAVDIACQTLEALAAAHEHRRRIVHRDLKPANIFITRLGSQADFVKLLDFGIAKAREHRLNTVLTAPGTEQGSWIGTPAYMSPEQADGVQDIDQCADIYAMGAVLYEMLTGRPAFAGDSFAQMIFMVASGTFLPPRSLDPAISPTIEKVILKAMAKDRRERYSSAVDMRDALRLALQDKEEANRVFFSSAPTAPEQKFELRRPLPRSTKRISIAIAAIALAIAAGAWLGLKWTDSRLQKIPVDPSASLDVKTEAAARPSKKKVDQTVSLPISATAAPASEQERESQKSAASKRAARVTTRAAAVKDENRGAIKGRAKTEFLDDYEK